MISVVRGNNSFTAKALMNSAYNKFVPIKDCPLCGDNEFSGYFNAEVEEKITLDYVLCECGMHFQPNFMSQEEEESFYKNKYRLCVDPFSGGVKKKNILGEKRRGRENMRLLKHFGIKPKKVLDVGSSTGAFMEIMKEAYGCEVDGVEPGDTFREYSIEQGFDTFADISEVSDGYNLITLVHVLEHLVKPLEMLSSIANLLEDGGVLFVEVPEMLVSFSHPLLFDDKSLEKMIIQAGYEILQLHRVPRKKIGLFATPEMIQ